jgi:ArsR family transcriptional regulator
VLVDMLPHDRDSYRQQMGHVWLGFSDEHMQRLLNSSGFEDARIVSLAPDAKAKGPGLFVATARKPRKHEDTKSD